MKLSSERTTVATPPSFGDGDGDGDGVGDYMNASLWGELHSFVDLSLIYAKLPLAPFFRLRQVCKEWNRLASNHPFLEQHFKPPISNLYFVVTRKTGHRLWTSSQDSSLWTSSPLPRRRCEASGLLYEDSDRHRVFNLHTRMFHSLPPLPSGKLVGDRCFVRMAVDFTQIPYVFWVSIREYIGTSGTTIYDSSTGAWTTPTSVDEMVGFEGWRRMLRELPPTLSNVHYKQKLYILHAYYIDTYDCVKHMWRYKVFGGSNSKWEYGGTGMWQDHRMKSKLVLEVWHMNTHFQESWDVFDRMPEDLCQWMMDSGSGEQNFLTTFCGEHVLVYNCFEVEAERAVLYNLDLKTWDKVEVFAKKSARSKQPLRQS